MLDLRRLLDSIPEVKGHAPRRSESSGCRPGEFSSRAARFGTSWIRSSTNAPRQKPARRRSRRSGDDRDQRSRRGTAVIGRGAARLTAAGKRNAAEFLWVYHEVDFGDPSVVHSERHDPGDAVRTFENQAAGTVD